MQTIYRVPVTAAVRADLKALLPKLAQAHEKKTPSALIEHLIQKAAQEAGEQQAEAGALTQGQGMEK